MKSGSTVKVIRIILFVQLVLAVLATFASYFMMDQAVHVYPRISAYARLVGESEKAPTTSTKILGLTPREFADFSVHTADHYLAASETCFVGSIVAIGFAAITLFVLRGSAKNK